MKKNEVMTLTVPADVSYMPAVLSCVREVARKTGFAGEDTDMIVLATDEAVANVIEHAFLPGQDANFDVVCESSSLGLKVIVKDKGYPFAPDKVEEYSVEKVMKGEKPTGLGLFLMKHSVDKVEFHNNGFGGKEVHLIKYLHRKHIEQYCDESELTAYESPAPPPEKPVEKIPYRVEPLDVEKSIEISQCAYRTYGYNYIHEFIYYPERIAEMNNSRELISAVAVNEKTNEIMSHAALEITKGKELVELGVAFTKPEYRHQGCFNRICEHLIAAAKEEGIKGIYATAVTIHPFSQKAILKNGFKECGVMIGAISASMFKDSPEQGCQRESVVILFHDVDQLLDRPLYAPEHHEEILKEIYLNIGVPVQWREAAGPDGLKLSREHAVIETTVDKQASGAEMYIMEYGTDVLEEIAHTLRELDRKKMEAVYLYLDLGDPLTAVMTKSFEEMGFFFAGMLPAGNRQNLVLQYLNDVRIDYDKICVASDFAGKMLSYVKALDSNRKTL